MILRLGGGRKRRPGPGPGTFISTTFQQSPTLPLTKRRTTRSGRLYNMQISLGSGAYYELTILDFFIACASSAL
jgi:hypothetical protein